VGTVAVVRENVHDGTGERICASNRGDPWSLIWQGVVEAVVLAVKASAASAPKKARGSAQKNRD